MDLDLWLDLDRIRRKDEGRKIATCNSLRIMSLIKDEKHNTGCSDESEEATCFSILNRKRLLWFGAPTKEGSCEFHMCKQSQLSHRIQIAQMVELIEGNSQTPISNLTGIHFGRMRLNP
ncbi:hypothetical protein VNO77_34553 [Canavalia gladiata]|uniref:Uncharacterized protein n=1 Tax=Canavalia gladiata TaxID=3824 RepID=A0AAN9PXB3_CANGL